MNESAPAQEHRPVDTSELFFDLVFVVSLTQVVTLIHEQPGALGLIRAAIVLVLTYWLWTVGSIQMAVRDMTSTRYRLVLFGTAFAAIVMTLAMTRAFEDRAVLFAGSYWAGRLIILSGMFSRQWRSLAPSIISVTVTCPAIMIGAFLEHPRQEMIWTVALIVELLSPRIQRSHLRTVHYDAKHIVERFGLLVLLALGESIVSIVEPLIHVETLKPEHVVTMVGSFVLIVALWWLYFHHTDGLVLRLAEHANTPADVVRTVLSYGHLIIVTGIIAVAVALKEAIHEPGKPLTHEIAILLVGGVILVLIPFVVVRFAVFRRGYTSRITGIVALLVVIPVVLPIEALFAVVMIAAITAAIAAWETAAPRIAGIPEDQAFEMLS